MRIHFEWRGAPGPVTYKNERNLIGGYFTNRSQAARDLVFAFLVNWQPLLFVNKGFESVL